MNATRPSPLLARGLEADLVRLLGRDAVLTGADRLLVYESDGLTRYRGAPAAVLLPGDTDGCAAAVALLHDAGVAVVARGAGTGLSGGAVPAEGAVIVGTARMNRILSIDATERRARVQPGVVNADLGRAARVQGMWYAPDPSSQSTCTLGGNVAENAGGPHCLKYGVTTRYVTALTVVGSGGRVCVFDRATTLHGALDVVGVFVGSEGCFGIATEIELALAPAPLEARTLLAAFDHTHEAGDAVTAILTTGLLPAALEIVDGATIRAVEASIYAAGYPLDAGAALVVEFDGAGPGLDDELNEAAELCRAAGARDVRLASTADGRAQLWAGRKKAFGAMGRIAPDLMVQDATVPRSRLAAVLRQVDEIAERHGLDVANVFHAGDGNLHPNLLFDRRDADQVERVERASAEIMRVCVDAGGTITGEHGVGLDKRGYMRLVCGADELAAMEDVRAAFDPAGRFNPGKVLPDRGEPIDRRERRESVGRAVELHDPADFTVTAAAEVPMHELQRTLAASGQWLAIDGPFVDDRSVGAVVAAGDDLALARSLGAVRDQVLGLTLLDGRGRVLELGGRVMKNVAGFDLTRLVCGSRGRLGRITRVVFRSWPLPREERFASLTTHDRPTLAAAIAALLAAPIVPLSVEVGGAASDTFEVLVRLGGSPAEVAHGAEVVERVLDRTVSWLDPTAGRERQRKLRRSVATAGARRVVTMRPSAGAFASTLDLLAAEPSARIWAIPDQGAAWVTGTGGGPSSDDTRAPEVVALETSVVGAFTPSESP